MMWTIEDALALIRGLQPKLKPLEWHIALGGSVLNTGSSRKDLDLYVLGFNGEKLQEIEPVVTLLESAFGSGLLLTGGDGYPPDPRYRTKLQFSVGGKRIDAFVQ